ncbi:Uncharacterised protein [Serratia proteamaculans]|nr:Uncharacterised protein [Serratia proteamaculans]
MSWNHLSAFIRYYDFLESNQTVALYPTELLILASAIHFEFNAYKIRNFILNMVNSPA